MNNDKILIIQFREGYLETNEQNAFAHRLGVRKDDLLFVNARNHSANYPSIENVSAMILAGSGDVSLLTSNSWFPKLELYLKQAIERDDLLILGICLGHQILAHLYGGKIETVENFKELGTISLSLTSDARQDPLFYSIDETFYAIAGHNDSVTTLPDNCRLLAKSNTCPIQAFKINRKPIYGMQFHPELDRNDFRARLEYYREHYIQNGTDFEAVLSRGKHKTTDQQILKNFIKLSSATIAPRYQELQDSTVSISPKY